MVDSVDKFDPALLQARWLLGGIDPEDLTKQAGRALLEGFDGPALRQLAGLMQPTLRDLGTLPERAFAEMHLHLLDRLEAVDVLVARGIPSVNHTMLVGAFPDFSMRWREHIARWAGERAGSYVDMAEFVHFVVEDLYERGRFEETRRAFECLEKLFVEGDQETRDLVGLGFFETLQNFASWRPCGNAVFEQFLGPMSEQAWIEIKRQWAGKSSLMDVSRAERDIREE